MAVVWPRASWLILPQSFTNYVNNNFVLTIDKEIRIPENLRGVNIEILNVKRVTLGA